MPHGLPDWGVVAAGTLGYTLDDLAEAVARLDSPVIFDRRGQVVLLDSFEQGLGLCVPAASSANSAYVIRDDASRHGSLSLQFQMVAEADTGGLVTWTTPITQMPRCGFEISFGFSPWVYYMYFRLHYRDGAFRYEAEVRLDNILLGDIRYLDVGNLWQLLGPMTLRRLDRPIHTLKLVCDFGTGYYLRLLLNQRVFDMSAYQIRQVGDLTGPYLESEYEVTGEVNHTSGSTVDRYILTQNEPT